MRILILGGYGLIGSALTKRLTTDGHSVTGMARSARKGAALIPSATWIGADISELTHADNWAEHLNKIEVVVNASGALQNGLRDNVGAVQRDSILALIKACEQSDVKHFVQISAPGAVERSTTQFYRSKAVADNALKSSRLQWTIFRPGLVISPQAYGGTSLIRKLAAFPLVQPIIIPKSPIQTVCIDDVANAVSIAIENRIVAADVDLVEDNAQTLLELTLKVRSWLGFAPPKTIWSFPYWIGACIARIADIAGWLGWRSALRTTSVRVLSDGVQGNPNPWQEYSNSVNKSLSQTLDSIPSTIQERIYARAMLLFPIILLTLAGFWFASGVIGLMEQDQALAKLDRALPADLSKKIILTGSIADIVIGATLLFRPFTRLACFASMIVSFGYLIASVVLTPHLWLDPLGPMVKVFPGIALALIITALLEDR